MRVRLQPLEGGRDLLVFRLRLTPGHAQRHLVAGGMKYYLSNLPADTAIRDLVRVIKARWVCEQAHQQLKEELGLDHFEGRSSIGLHRHALLGMMAYAFLQSCRLKAAGRKKTITGPPPQPSLPAIRQAILDRILRPPCREYPHCGRTLSPYQSNDLPK